MNNIQLQVDLINIVLASIAVVALVAARRQLLTMQQDSQTQIGIAKQQELATRASVLLSLIDRFESPAVMEGRREMTALIERVNDKADKKWQALATTERRKKGVDLYPDELETLRRALPPDAYMKLMAVCSFFENVGYVTKSKYIPLDDIHKLFGPSIDSAGMIFMAHIIKLQDIYRSNTLYDNFLWLIEQSGKAS